MAFPVATWAETTIALTTTATVNLPASIAEGDLLVCIARTGINTTQAYTFPSGWVELKDQQQTSTTSGDRVTVAYKFVIAGSAEIGASTMNVTQGNSKGAYSVARITGAHTSSPPELSSDATGTGTTPDPLSLTASWGSADNLWLWLGCWENETTSPPASQPTNYSSPGGASSGTAGNPDTNTRTAHASRNNATATEDPPSWTISTSSVWIAWTMVIRPAPPPVPSLLVRPINRFNKHLIRR